MPPKSNNHGVGPSAANTIVPTPQVHTTDRDVDAVLRKSQPGNFSGEGKDVGKVLEDWIERMDDYFDLANSTPANQAMIAKFRLEKTAKRWWKDHCTENDIPSANVTWPMIKEELRKKHHTKVYQSDCINSFLDCTQGSMDLETYYQHFLTLVKYAPAGMTQEVKVARFVSGLGNPLKTRLQSLRLTTFADVLDAGKPIEQELSSSIMKRKQEVQPERDNRRPRMDNKPNPIQFQDRESAMR